MRRSLLVFMMVLLPVQWVWAAGASTYLHESEVSTPQFSKHVHEHVHEHVVEQVNGAADPASFAADHPHCGGSHVWADMGFADATLQPVTMWACERIGTTSPAFDSHVPAGPERPDRSATP